MIKACLRPHAESVANRVQRLGENPGRVLREDAEEDEAEKQRDHECNGADAGVRNPEGKSEDGKPQQHKKRDDRKTAGRVAKSDVTTRPRKESHALSQFPNDLPRFMNATVLPLVGGCDSPNT